MKTIQFNQAKQLPPPTYLPKHLLMFLGLFLISSTGIAQFNSNQTPSLFNSIYDVEKLSIEIITDLDKVINERKSVDYIDSKITFYDGKEEISQWDIGVIHRGRFRRRICDFPPIKLNFSKKALKENGLANFDKFKLITHCLDDKTMSTEFVARELLAYRIYNEISPYSYRAKFVKVTYRDHKNKGKKIQRYGVLVEPTSELEARINATEVDEDMMNPDPNLINTTVENQVSMFQYMIGNEDWSIQMMRNVKAFQSNADGKYILVPYDFDFSGLVNASYAIPNNNYGLSSVEQRYYLGMATTPNILRYTKKLFESKKDHILKIIKDLPKLSSGGEYYISQYIEAFYTDIDLVPVPMVSEADLEAATKENGGK